MLACTGIHISEFPSPEHWNLNTDEGIEAMLVEAGQHAGHTQILCEEAGG